jgi:hypothetical protein
MWPHTLSSAGAGIVRANATAPGPIWTPRLAGAPEKILAELSQNIAFPTVRPAGRIRLVGGRNFSDAISQWPDHPA